MKLKFLIVPLAFLAALVIVVISTEHASSEGAACKAKPGVLANFKATNPHKSAPEATFFAVDKNGAELPRTLSDFKGTGLVVNFWATWCAPCVREMPALDRLSAQTQGKGLRVLAISEDRKGAKKAKKFYDKINIKNLDIYVDHRGKMLKKMGVTGLPTTVLYNAQGREVGRVIGIAEWDAPETVDFLLDCLAPPPAATKT